MLRLIDIEDWCLAVAQRVLAGEPVEDDRVELKSSWIDAAKAAQRIAAHSNSATPDAALWIFGLDEKSQSAPGASKFEFSSWWAAVEARFDGKAPGCRVLAVPFNEATLVAVLFDTTDAPYVVKNPTSGQLEVPWREGTRSRPARRQELVRLLAPRKSRPKLVCDHAHLRVVRVGDAVRCDFSLRVVFVIDGESLRTFLADDIECDLHVCGVKACLSLSFCILDEGANGESRATRQFLALRGTNVVRLQFAEASVEGAAEFGVTAEAKLRVRPVDLRSPVSLALPLRKTNDVVSEAGFSLDCKICETD